MRFRPVCLCFCLLFILAGCTPGSDAPPKDEIREYYAALPELTLSARLRTDFGDRIIDFSVRYTHRLEGQGEMEILSPEMIRGITAKVSEGDVTLTYDGLELSIGALPGTGLSPMESLPLMVWDWSRGYLVAQSLEHKDGREFLLRTYRSAREGVVYENTTLFDENTLLPVRGELYIGGICAVSAFFEESE